MGGACGEMATARFHAAVRDGRKGLSRLARPVQTQDWRGLQDVFARPAACLLGPDSVGVVLRLGEVLGRGMFWLFIRAPPVLEPAF